MTKRLEKIQTTVATVRTVTTQVKFKVSKTKSAPLAARILSVTFNELPHVVRMRTLQCQTLLNNFLFAICLKQQRIAMNEANEKRPECH